MTRSNGPTRGTIETLPSGALRVKVYAGVDPISKRRLYLTETVSAGPQAAKQADKVLTRLINQVNEKRNPRTKAAVHELFAKYFDVVQIEPSSLRRDQQNYRNHIQPLIGTTSIGDVDAHVLDSLYAELLRCREHCGRKRGHGCKGLAASTVRKVHFLLSAALGRAVRWGWITSNPADTAVPPPQPNPNPKPPSPQDAARIINASWDDPGWGTFVWVATNTGCRRGELCALRWCDVDLDNGTLSISRSIDQDGVTLTEKATKSHQDRRIALDTETIAVLADHRARCEELATQLGRRLAADAFVFSPTVDTTPAKPSTMTQRYRRLAERLGIDTSLHKLRHYSATELIAAGVDPRTVGGRLGHSGGGSTTLRVYSAWVAESDQRAAKSLSGRMPPRPANPGDPIERAKTDPRSPYEIVAHKIRQNILDRRLAPGSHAPTQKDIARDHGVSIGTANRAFELLKSWKLVDGGRGRRSVILEPSDPEPATLAGSPERNAQLLDLRLMSFGKSVRDFTAEANPSDPSALRELLSNAARRHGGSGVDLADYELEVRRHGSSELLTTFAAM